LVIIHLFAYNNHQHEYSTLQDILYMNKDSILPIGTLATDIHCMSTFILSQAITVNNYTCTDHRKATVLVKMMS